ncbi:hypothetical protein PAXRUDRAFT_836267 [Paxillus rubicundulus Ve08.2h10]|uniref:Uncharacterized protein n=1 Tax=Paxillus rubicundulus Ve08.2h10 TaxID=930991 RepID=A0A0D0CCX3_9AGAM|nr:hypothetical protein PAXRUDRAFT_836267 [Paxillus rubicundulus Ve08.2h10]
MGLSVGEEGVDSVQRARADTTSNTTSKYSNAMGQKLLLAAFAGTQFGQVTLTYSTQGESLPRWNSQQY